MAVALERHQLVDVHRAELGDPADVVAGEVDEHHVLGPFLRVLGELGGHPAVVLLGRPTPAGAGDRARDHPTVEQLHHRLGRRPDDRQLRMAHEVHVRRRVDLAEHAVHVERIGVEVEVVALGQHDLEDVAGDDVLLGHLDRLLVQPARHRRVRGRAARRPATAARPACRRAAWRDRRPPGRPARPPRRRPRRAASVDNPSVGTLSIRYTRWRQWSNAASEPITDITASG